LGGLSGQAEAWAFAEGGDVVGGEDHVELVEILGDTTDLHMIPDSDDDGVESGAYEVLDGAMGGMDEGAGGFQDAMSGFPECFDASFGGAVGGDHDGGGLDLGGVTFQGDALLAEAVKDGFIMDEVAQDGEGLAVGGFEGEGDGVADAEAHAEMLGAVDFHGAGIGGWLCRAK